MTRRQFITTSVLSLPCVMAFSTELMYKTPTNIKYTITCQTLELDKPTINNRTYPTKLIEMEMLRLATQIKEKKLFISEMTDSGFNDNVILDVNGKNIVGIVEKMYIKNNFLVIEIELIKYISNPLYTIAPYGIGSVDKYNTVQNDYELL